jgi:DNA invertase Pin-like site-specific DNA recombinase
MTKRAVLYARTNNDDEPKLAEQPQMCRECARDHGWQVAAELAKQGVSGLSSATPQRRVAFAGNPGCGG